MPTRTLTITRARAMEHGGLADRPEATVTIVLEGTVGNRRVRGFGEASFGTEQRTRAAGWAAALDTLPAALGAIELNRRGQRAAVADAANRIEKANQSAGSAPDPLSDAGLRAAQAAIEAALIDVGARALETPAARLLGRRASRHGDLAKLVGNMTRYAEAPETPAEPVTYGPLTANAFDMGSVHGFGRNGNWELTMISHLLEKSALAHGLDTIRESPRILLVQHPDLTRPVAFYSSRTNEASTPAMSVTSDKNLTRRFLADAGVPVPAGASFEVADHATALDYAASLGGPVVIKPVRGSHGDGVATDLTSRQDLTRAIDRVRSLGADRFLVEQCVTGDDYRFLVVGDRVVSVVLKRPASIIGDGRSTVLDLVVAKNVRKLENPHACRRLIKLKGDAEFWLKRQDLTLESVPEAGRTVRLTSAANGSLGADTIEVLDETHESLCAMAVRATQAIPGLDVAGVDLMTTDHRSAPGEQGAYVIEVNGEPGTALNHFPFFGPPRDVSHEILRRSSALAGAALGGSCKDVGVQVTVEGDMPPGEYAAWLADAAAEHGVDCTIDQEEHGTVVASVGGDVQPVATVTSRSFAGPYADSVVRVTARHIR